PRGDPDPAVDRDPDAVEARPQVGRRSRHADGHGGAHRAPLSSTSAATSRSFGAIVGPSGSTPLTASTVLRPCPVMLSTTSSSGPRRPARASASAAATVTPPAVSAKTPVSSASTRMPATSSASVTACAQPPVARIARAANMPSAGLPIAIESAMVLGISGTMRSSPRSTSRTIGAHPSAWAPNSRRGSPVTSPASRTSPKPSVSVDTPLPPELGPPAVGGAGVGEVAGRRAPHGLEPEGGGGVERGSHHPVLEGERGMRDGVVLHPGPRHSEAAGEPGGFEKRREPRVQRVNDVALEGEPLAVAPQRGRPGRDGRAVGKRAGGIVHGVQRAETLLADRDGRRSAVGAAAPAAERSGARRGAGGGRQRGGERRGHRVTK